MDIFQRLNRGERHHRAADHARSRPIAEYGNRIIRFPRRQGPPRTRTNTARRGRRRRGRRPAARDRRTGAGRFRPGLTGQRGQNMSVLMVLRVALKALGRNKDADQPDHAGDDHRRGRGHHDGGPRPGRAAGNRDPDSIRRHEHDHGPRREFPPRRHQHGDGPVAASQGGRRRGHSRAGARRAVPSRPASGPGTRSSRPAGTGTPPSRGRTSSSPRSASGTSSSAPSSPRPMSRARPRWRCWDRSSATNLFGEGVDPRSGRACASATSRSRCSGSWAAKGSGQFGEDQDDAIFVPLHDGQQEAAGPRRHEHLGDHHLRRLGRPHQRRGR